MKIQWSNLRPAPCVLRPLCGQVTIEYFILFAIVALLTIAGLTTVDDQVRTRLQDFFRVAANDIAH